VAVRGLGEGEVLRSMEGMIFLRAVMVMGDLAIVLAMGLAAVLERDLISIPGLVSRVMRMMDMFMS
jgi:hypothetical protein